MRTDDRWRQSSTRRTCTKAVAGLLHRLLPGKEGAVGGAARRDIDNRAWDGHAVGFQQTQRRRKTLPQVCHTVIPLLQRLDRRRKRGKRNGRDGKAKMIIKAQNFNPYACSRSAARTWVRSAMRAAATSDSRASDSRKFAHSASTRTACASEHRQQHKTGRK